MSIEKKRILIIDDSTDDIQFVMENLKDEFAVLVATSGQKGLEIAAKDPKPDVILMDVMMPEMDGYETCRLLKANSVTEGIEVIFVSAHDTTKEKLAGYDAGGSDYLIKPVQPEELVQKVNLAISNKEVREETSEQKDMAFKTAMTAMTSAGEQGVVLEFLRHSSSVNTIQELAEMVVSSNAQYELENTVQLRSGNEIFTSGTKSPVPPLEDDLLTRLKDKERIMEYGKRAVFNFGNISLLIKNMPEDDDKRGRLRDHIAILLEGAETKLSALEMGQQLAQLVVDSNQALQEIESGQKSYKVVGQKIMDDMLQNLESSFTPWGLTEYQEKTLIEIIQTGINKSLDHFEEGMTLDEKMAAIISRLAKISK